MRLISTIERDIAIYTYRLAISNLSDERLIIKKLNELKRELEDVRNIQAKEHTYQIVKRLEPIGTI